MTRKVKEPTDWVSSHVAVEKPNEKLRIFIALVHLNQVTLSLTFDRCFSRISWREKSSKQILKMVFLHIKLDSESSLLTTS